MTDKAPEARPGSLDAQHDASVTWRYMAPAGHTLDDCRHPGYWKNVVRECGQQRVVQRHAFNKIEIIAEDGTWEAELRVMSVADGMVHTRLLREWTEAAKPGRKPSVPDGYTVEMVAGNGWRALEPGRDIIAQKLTTEDAALQAARQHARKAKGE